MSSVSLHNHSRFRHPHIIQFREVFLTPTHPGLAMEVATADDLFKRVKSCKGLAMRPALIAQSAILCTMMSAHPSSAVPKVWSYFQPKLCFHILYQCRVYQGDMHVTGRRQKHACCFSSCY